MDQARMVVDEVLSRMIRELVPFTQADGTLPADLEPLVDLVARGDLAPAA
jgi:hypothetical protein